VCVLLAGTNIFWGGGGGTVDCWSRWPCCVRSSSAAARLLGF
jgi:hypothetical protein